MLIMNIKKILSAFAFSLVICASVNPTKASAIPIPITFPMPVAPTTPIFPIIDGRLLGNPGDINVTKDGAVETHIGKDGKADAERHHSDHGNPKHHKNPHDHKIDWINEKPKFTPSTDKLFQLFPGEPGYVAKKNA